MKVAIFGASGLLGQALMQEWAGDEIVGLSSRDVDIRNARKVMDVAQNIRPEWIVLSAAYTDVDGCESQPDLAYSVNRDGAVNVANSAKNIGAKLLFLSSDYVFDGQKTSPYETNDTRNPISIYGRSKAEAEMRLIELLPECCIVRTSWLFGSGGKCFPDTILKLAASRPTLNVVNDQRGCPTYTVDLARTIIELCRRNAEGIVHVNNAGECSWFDFATEIVTQAGLPTKVSPITTEQMPRPARRPPYSVLSADSLKKQGLTMPTWKDALQRYLLDRRP